MRNEPTTPKPKRNEPTGILERGGKLCRIAPHLTAGAAPKPHPPLAPTPPMRRTDSRPVSADLFLPKHLAKRQPAPKLVQTNPPRAARNQPSGSCLVSRLSRHGGAFDRGSTAAPERPGPPRNPSFTHPDPAHAQNEQPADFDESFPPGPACEAPARPEVGSNEPTASRPHEPPASCLVSPRYLRDCLVSSEEEPTAPAAQEVPARNEPKTARKRNEPKIAQECWSQ